MTFFRCTLATLMLCVAFVVPTAAPADLASSSEARQPLATASACPSTIRLGNRRFAFYKRGRVDCTRARRAVRRLWETYGRAGRPRGFRCRSTNRFRRSGSCRASSTRYFLYNR